MRADGAGIGIWRLTTTNEIKPPSRAASFVRLGWFLEESILWIAARGSAHDAQHVALVFCPEYLGKFSSFELSFNRTTQHRSVGER